MLPKINLGVGVLTHALLAFARLLKPNLFKKLIFFKHLKKYLIFYISLP